jgi:hypothetical protein
VIALPFRGSLSSFDPWLPPRDVRVLVDDRLLELRLHPRALDQPEIGIDLQLADGEVRRRVGAVTAQDGDALGRHPGAPEQVEHLTDVQEVGLVVLRRVAAPVDHEDVQPLGPARMRARRRPRLAADEEKRENQR